MQSKDYFIKDSGISAYTINAFVEAIVEATKAGQSIDQDSARRIGMSFSVSFEQPKEELVQAQEEPTVETQAPAQEETPESPAQPEAAAEGTVDISGGTAEVSGDTVVTEKPFTVEDIEQAKDSMVELNKLAEPVGLSARSKREMVNLLKQYIGIDNE